MNKENKYDDIFKYFKENDKDILDFQNYLGEGAFGTVRLCTMKNKKFYAAKLVEKEKCDKILTEKLRGKHFIDIIKITETKYGDKYYNLIIMELALLGNLKIFFRNLFDMKLLKTINWPFDEIVGNNILRFFAKQIVDGMKIFEKNKLVHFDIKPENILITSQLKLKISDFNIFSII